MCARKRLLLTVILSGLQIRKESSTQFENELIFVNFHHYRMSSQIVVLGNDDEKDVLELRTNHSRLLEGTMLSLPDALYAPMVRCFLVSFVPKISFL